MSSIQLELKNLESAIGKKLKKKHRTRKKELKSRLLCDDMIM